MKNSFPRFFILLLLTFLFNSAFGQWTQLPVYAGHWFEKIDFPTDQHGYAKVYSPDSSTNYLAKTTDGGNSWSHVFIDSRFNGDLQSIHFANPDTGLISWRAVSTAGMRVFKTFNGGSTWTDVSPDTARLGTGVSAVHAGDADRFYFSVDGYYFVSTNSGASWDTVNLGGYTINEFDFYNFNYGLGTLTDATFMYQGGVWMTDLAGTVISQNNFPQYYSTTFFPNYPESGKAYCYSNIQQVGRLHKTTNAGTSWDTTIIQALSPFDAPIGMEFTGNNVGFIGTGFGFIYMTTDNGDTWTTDRQMDSIMLNCMAQSPGKVWAGGLTEGVLLVRDLGTGISDPFTNKKINVYPNPAPSRSQVFLGGLSSPIAVQFQWLDLQGRKISNGWLKAGENQVPVPDLPEGIYLLEVNEYGAQKIIVR